MNKKIHIEKPCTVDFNSMRPDDSAKFCNHCQTKVVDFTNMSLDEIKNFFDKQTSDKICGRYHTRHTNGSNHWLNFLTNVESFFSKTKFRKVAFWAISILLFLTNSYGCIVMGKRVNPKPKTGKKTAQSMTKGLSILNKV